MVAENAFGRLKGRFRILMKRNDCDLDTTLAIVAASVVLHNICELSGDTYDEGWSVDSLDNSLLENRHCCPFQLTMFDSYVYNIMSPIF